MNKKTVILALTGIMSLAACGQGDKAPTADTVKPTVTLTAAPSPVVTGGTFTLTAEAKDNVGVTKVVFYEGDSELGTDETAANGFTHVVTAGTVGDHIYTARAYDKANNMAEAEVKVIVTAVDNGTGPGNGGTNPGNGGNAPTPAEPVTPPAVSVDPADYATVGGITFDTDQYLKTSSRGLTGEYNDGGVWKNQKTGWRYIRQVTSTPSNPEVPVNLKAVYVKGKDLKVSYTAPNPTDDVTLYWHSTSGVPKAEELSAKNKLKSGIGGINTTIDTTEFENYESAVQWLVIRNNTGGTITYRPIIADNLAPIPAEPELTRGSVNKELGRSNIRHVPAGGKVLFPYNWANGNVGLNTPNTANIRDEKFGPAPTVGVTPVQRVPAGLESITYYFVPDTVGADLEKTDGDLRRRADVVRTNAVAATAPVKARKDGGEGTENYNAEFDSVAGAVETTGAFGTVAENTLYRVYAITRDYMGNEVASPTFTAVKFDNTGPVVSTGLLCDVSPLPFVSTEPCKYISDVAMLSVGGITDAGIGSGDISGKIKLVGSLGSKELTGRYLDTNELSDGEYKLEFVGLTDLLGNPANIAESESIWIDNTDPTVTVHLQGSKGKTVVAGTEINATSQGNDYGGTGVYQNLLFWEGTDNTPAKDNVSFQFPVEFGQRATSTPVRPAVNNQTLQAGGTLLAPYLYDNNNGNAQSYNIRGLAIDRAGNASLEAETVRVIPNQGKGIVFNKFDAYMLDASPIFWKPGSFLAPTPTGSTEIAPNKGKGVARLALQKNGIYTNDTAASLMAPSFQGRFDKEDWELITDYQNGTGDLIAGLSHEAIRNNTIREGLIKFIKLAKQRDGRLTEDDIKALVALGFSETDLKAAMKPLDPALIDFFRKFDAATGNPLIANPEDIKDPTQLPDNFISNSINNITPGLGYLLFESVAPVTGVEGDRLKDLVNNFAKNIDQTLENDASLADIAGKLLSDPTLIARPAVKTQRALTGWGTYDGTGTRVTDVILPPLLSLGESKTESSVYAIDTNMVNNLYVAQDGVANSVPNTTNDYAKALYGNKAIKGTYDALTFVLKDTNGAYNAAGELVKGASK